jgi:hypothetical protein
MSTPAPERVTPREKVAATQTGHCLVPGCRQGCARFDFVGVKDGFRMCECGHTQFIHFGTAV